MCVCVYGRQIYRHRRRLSTPRQTGRAEQSIAADKPLNAALGIKMAENQYTKFLAFKGVITVMLHTSILSIKCMEQVTNYIVKLLTLLSCHSHVGGQNS